MGVRLKQYALTAMGTGGPPAYLKAVAEWVRFLAMLLFKGQCGADEPSAFRHPLSSQAPMRVTSRTLWALDKKDCTHCLGRCLEQLDSEK